MSKEIYTNMARHHGVHRENMNLHQLLDMGLVIIPRYKP